MKGERPDRDHPMSRTVRDFPLPRASSNQVGNFLVRWLSANGFTILESRSTGEEKRVSHWDGSLILHPESGALVAVRAWPGGGTIVFELTLVPSTSGTTVHLEGYVTARGPGWAGKEYDFLASSLAIGGLLRKQGTRLLSRFATDVGRFAVASSVPLAPALPLATSASLPAPDGPPQRAGLVPPTPPPTSAEGSLGPRADWGNLLQPQEATGGLRCGTCGRRLHWRWNPRAGNCSRDGVFECFHCTGLARRCPRCGRRVSDAAYSCLFMGVFLLLVLGPSLGGLLVPLAVTNARLDALPITPLSGVEPGHAYKVFATIAPNQTDVVYGHWVGRTWSWTTRPFLLVENGSSLLVNASGLVNLREPGSPWGNQAGTAAFSSGDPVAVYGTATRVGNATVLDAQYISPDPASMGKSAGDLWPLVAGIIGLVAVTAVVGVFLVTRQRQAHARNYATHLPGLVDPSPRPSAYLGEPHRFTDGGAARRVRQSRNLLAVGGPACLLGAALMATNLVGPVFIGIFLLILGAIFLLLGGVIRAGRWQEVAALVMDDAGIWVEPLVPASYRDDPFIGWNLFENFWVYRFGKLGSTLALRTRRGEFLIGSLAPATVEQIVAELRRRGRSEAREWRSQSAGSSVFASGA